MRLLLLRKVSLLQLFLLLHIFLTSVAKKKTITKEISCCSDAIGSGLALTFLHQHIKGNRLQAPHLL